MKTIFLFIILVAICIISDSCKKKPIASFDAPETVNVGDSVLFKNTSQDASRCVWDFGDGFVSFSSTISHTYTQEGSFLVVLEVYSKEDKSKSVASKTITVRALAPIAEFSSNATFVNVGQAVSFFDLSQNKPTSWYWDFGDSTSSTLQHPAHSYNSLGSYTVTLKATNKIGNDTIIKINYISVVGMAPMGNFSVYPTNTYVDEHITFTDLSQNIPTTWLWNFGDGGNSFSQNPVHIYATTGLYYVTLTATNSFGSNSKIQVISITNAANYLGGYYNYIEVYNGETANGGSLIYISTTTNNKIVFENIGVPGIVNGSTIIVPNTTLQNDTCSHLISGNGTITGSGGVGTIVVLHITDVENCSGVITNKIKNYTYTKQY